jgi:Uncharacterized protein family UPF0004
LLNQTSENMLLTSGYARAARRAFSTRLRAGPGLADFIRQQAEPAPSTAATDESAMSVPASAWQQSSAEKSAQLQQRTFYIETYGCQMNLSDSELVRSVLLDAGYSEAPSVSQAAVVFANTCAIRENAEIKVWERLKVFGSIGRKRRLRALRLSRGYNDTLESGVQADEPPDLKVQHYIYILNSDYLANLSIQHVNTLYGIASCCHVQVGVLGCMAERLKTKMLEGNLVDLVAGPDAYRDLPRLLDIVHAGNQEEAGELQLYCICAYSFVNQYCILYSKGYYCWHAVATACSKLCFEQHSCSSMMHCLCSCTCISTYSVHGKNSSCTAYILYTTTVHTRYTLHHHCLISSMNNSCQCAAVTR